MEKVMSSWETPATGAGADGVVQISSESAQRAFMARVYRWMFAGLAITGSVALYTASTPALLQPVSQFIFPLLIGELVLVFALSWLAPRISGTLAAALFILYAALNGLTFSMLFVVYQLGSIGEAFLLTGGAFAALSIYATATKKDLSAWRTFLFIGLIGVTLAGIVQVFWQNQGFSFVWSCACVVVFAGLTAYDTQKLRQLHATSGYRSTASLSVNGALILYLDFVNLFLALLRLFGRKRD